MAGAAAFAGGMPVTEICGACGFNSLAWFYRLFTERYGCAPKAFRTQFAHAQSAARFAYVFIIIVLPFDFLKRID
ncbi:helix-turn-helix domain-containing protein [Hominenteromicrobium sp.]|uniref:helix-turn-helix domain-containing protein n=1 Tax=Hominenteromicrobium sp. TaxID=3073581 RepID=UPI00399BEBED